MLRNNNKNIWGKSFLGFHWGVKMIAFFSILLSPSLVMAISSASYQIDPSGTDGVFHVSTSTSYQLEGAVEPINGLASSSSYMVESGSSFSGYCGDGGVDPTEDCDGANLNSKTCVTQGFVSGSLSCSAACTFNTSSCSNTGGSSGGGGGGGGGSALSSPTFDNIFLKKTFSYLGEILFYGNKPADARDVYFEKSTAGVTYPTIYRWNKKSALKMGKNNFEIYAANVSIQSSPSYYTITRRRIGDINLDNKVNDYDFSLLASRWSQNWAEADFNEDFKVDDYDLSLMVVYWTE